MNNKKIISVIAIILAILMLITLVVGILPASAFADSDEDYSVNTQASLEELQARKEELSAKAEESKNKIAELEQNQAALIEQKAVYDERDAYIREQIAITDEQIKLYRGLVEEKQKEVEAARDLEQRQLERYRTRVRAMEENGEYDILSVVLHADSLSQLLSGIDDIRDIMESDRRLEEQYIAAREEHERVQAEYEQEKDRYEAAMAELRNEQVGLREAIWETEELMKKLDEELETNAAEYEAAMAAIQTADEAIDNKIAQLYAAYLASLNVNVNTAEGDLSLETSDDGETYISYSGASGTLMWPVPGCYSVSSEYGTRTHPITGEVSKMHYGMDIDGYAHDGGDIVACDGGVVTDVGYNSGYGNYIIVDHGNGMQTLYAHMSGTAVAEGTTVDQGETIGYLGQTGMATGTHCHVEVFVDGQNVDPADYLG
ncbi:MAG: peptidoglycan DD-metalloendopeptidase family protein [Oscillospiraceae bacterium]|nr:peptidoglycan DD-metalloendopeptidase family protein [Oscillospiraceae bacterium]